jgi:phospholipase/carboxylesterase
MTSSRFSSWSDAALPEFGYSIGGERASDCSASSGAASDSTSSPAEIILSSDTQTQVCEDTARRTVPQVHPCGVFVPENYEPNYAYPLIVWLHEAGRSERDIAEVLPMISMRNYLGLALRGTARTNGDAGEAFSWSRTRNAGLEFEERLHASVRQMRRDFHIHTERVFLVGAGEGGTMAWDLFLTRPQWFAGVAALGGRFPWGRRPLRQFRDLCGKHALIVADGQKSPSRAQAEQVGRLLYAAGLEVAVRAPASGPALSRPLMRQVDRWIMRSIGGCL